MLALVEPLERKLQPMASSSVSLSPSTKLVDGTAQANNDIRMYINTGPILASKLSEISGSGLSWMIGGSSSENLATDQIMHGAIPSTSSSVPILGTTTRISDNSSTSTRSIDTAQRLIGALDGATVPAGESDTVGRIVIICCDHDHDTSSSGPPSVNTCMKALGLKMTVDRIKLREESTMTKKDWSSLTHQKYGFCYDDEVDDIDDATSDQSKIISATKIMSSELIDHFEYNMSEQIVCAPVLYGGRIKIEPTTADNDDDDDDNNNKKQETPSSVFVAILSMRVWT